ncbi:hypothetical protein QF040_006272 [Variovorax sp. W2I14]
MEQRRRDRHGTGSLRRSRPSLPAGPEARRELHGGPQEHRQDPRAPEGLDRRPRLARTGSGRPSRPGGLVPAFARAAQRRPPGGRHRAHAARHAQLAGRGAPQGAVRSRRRGGALRRLRRARGRVDALRGIGRALQDRTRQPAGARVAAEQPGHGEFQARPVRHRHRGAQEGTRSASETGARTMQPGRDLRDGRPVGGGHCAVRAVPARRPELHARHGLDAGRKGPHRRLARRARTARKNRARCWTPRATTRRCRRSS